MADTTNIKSLVVNTGDASYQIHTSDIYEEMGLTAERFAELLARDFYCPLLASAPTESTLTYIDSDGSSNHFSIGQECRVPEEENSEYVFYKFMGTYQGKAVWNKIPSQLSDLNNDSDYIQAEDAEDFDAEIVGRVVKDATLHGEKVYLSAHASATLTSKGETVDEALDNIDEWSSFYKDVNRVSSVSNIPKTKRLVVAEISTDASLSMAGVPDAGKDIHIMVHNTGSNAIVVTLPVSGGYVNTAGSELTIDSLEWAEVNVISDGSTIYIRGL